MGELRDISVLQTFCYLCQKSKGSTNDQGGWCKQASTEKGGQHMTDASLIPALSQFLKNKSVSSFGDGPGAYKREMLKLGELKSYDAYDGAPYCEETSEGKVKFLDLTIPQYGIPLYDWIISLEVAEHIPTKYENIYLDNIYRHAKEGIILSWAVPGQGGLSHINNRPLEYVVNSMMKNGFVRDEKASKYLQGAASLPWIQSNLNVYRKKNSETTKSADDFTTWFL